MPENSVPENSVTEIRTFTPEDRRALLDILKSGDVFKKDEIDVAMELIDDSIENPKSDYWIRVATLDRKVVGYICFGPTPMTEATYDLYWIVTHQEATGKGVATGLIGAMESELSKKPGTAIRVETSQTEGYGAARKLYEKCNYPETARFKDFYKKGDDLIVYFKKLNA